MEKKIFGGEETCLVGSGERRVEGEEHSEDGLHLCVGVVDGVAPHQHEAGDQLMRDDGAAKDQLAETLGHQSSRNWKRSHDVIMSSTDTQEKLSLVPQKCLVDFDLAPR